ncbi:MAG: N-6 DNA methylase, partial [Candidatus Sumerlaeota bacterium]|nr:N-6 DNA methylase [Candidatus Sumerlaeota bacterium]
RLEESEVRRLHRIFWNQGLATLLVLVLPTEVRVYTGLVRPARVDEEPDSDNRLVMILDRTTQALELRRLLHQVETGVIYEDDEYAPSFQSNQAVDQYMLENLQGARDQLRDSPGNLGFPFIHALLGRVIFTCYLRDRKIINGSFFEAAGAPGATSLRELLTRDDWRSARDRLYKLFDNLQQVFNGSMFEKPTAEERAAVHKDHIEILRRFLCGERMVSAQRELFDWPYDFSVIPIETISAIYESFIAAEDAEEQQQSGAFYTPKHLAEMVVDVALEDWLAKGESLLDKTFLDPSCGSGIFLVILFNRLAEEWRRRNSGSRNLNRAAALMRLLQGRLRGIDRNPTACRIACFSLYLAFLDQLDPRDIQQLGGSGRKVLPPLLSSEESAQDGSAPDVIRVGDFFECPPDQSGGYDLVIGNPPWVGRSRGRTEKAKEKSREYSRKAEEWCLSRSNPFLALAPRGGKRLDYFLPQKQLAHAFAWKAPLHVRKEGVVCLLLPSKVFLNRTDRFQALWFSQVHVEKIIQLSDWRFILFENAICPATIVRFRPAPPPDRDWEIEY